MQSEVINGSMDYICLKMFCRCFLAQHARTTAAEPGASVAGASSPHATSMQRTLDRAFRRLRSNVQSWPILGIAIVSTRAANPAVSLSALSDVASLPSEFRSGSTPTRFPWAFLLVHEAVQCSDESAERLDPERIMKGV